MGIINHSDAFVSIKEVSRAAPIQRNSDPECKKPILLNSLPEEIDLPTRNGLCFTLHGKFWEADPVYDDFIDSIDKRFCFDHGQWSPNFELEKSSTLISDGARWEVFYTIRRKESL